MLGINYLKFDPMNYVVHYRNGKVVKEGKGLSFFYITQNSTIVSIPLNSQDIPFIFKVMTSDFQTVNVQGQITFSIQDPMKINDLLDFSVNNKKYYLTDDIDKLSQRILNEAQTIVGSFIHNYSVTNSLSLYSELDESLLTNLKKSGIIESLGLDIISVNVLKISADPEMQRALEARTREALQKDADKAIYDRRNFAVEQERKIKESELNTEIAVEEKQKQIVEKKMETDLTKQENTSKLKRLELDSNLELESKNRELVKLKSENIKEEADARGYQIEQEVKPYREMDWRVIEALNFDSESNSPKNQIALAFRELASNQTKINQLNITPDLLQNLIEG